MASKKLNEFGQPIGEDVVGWQVPERPNAQTLEGQFCRLERLNNRHGADLNSAYNAAGNEGLWTYMPVGPFETEAAFNTWMDWACESPDPLFYAIVSEETGQAVGVASYLRIAPEAGSIEVGYIAFSPLLQRTRASTEAMFIMMRHVFDDLAYRRYEWKCDAHNAPSRSAARRFGFTFEGIFRQATINKGRNRDTAWFAIIDKDWPQIKTAFEQWLAPENFGSDGTQINRLQVLDAKTD